MRTPEQLEYHRQWMRDYRKRKSALRVLSKGHCPVCGMLLSEIEFHEGCPFLSSPLHAEIEKIKEKNILEI